MGHNKVLKEEKGYSKEFPIKNNSNFIVVKRVSALSTSPENIREFKNKI